MRDKGLIFDLEDILISYNLDTKAEADLILDFLLQRKYIFQSDDLEGITPSEFIAEFSGWRGKDREILDNEIGKFQRQALFAAQGAPGVSGVLQALSAKYLIAVISRSRGDGIIKALSNVGIRGYISYIVPGESWLNQRKPGIALDLVMAKFPDISGENWSYVGLQSHKFWAVDRNVRFLPYGLEAYEDLEDIMEELL